MELENNIDEEIYVFMINKYINFYKKEIKNNDFFEGIAAENLSSTSDQMELFNLEMEKFKNLNEDFKNLSTISNKNKIYIITKNKQKYLTTDSLLSGLIELYNLENEDPESLYEIILNK